jgi:hypothetical protein
MRRDSGRALRESDQVGPRRTTSDNVGCEAEIVGGLCGPGVRAAIRSSDLLSFTWYTVRAIPWYHPVDKSVVRLIHHLEGVKQSFAAENQIHGPGENPFHGPGEFLLRRRTVLRPTGRLGGGDGPSETSTLGLGDLPRMYGPSSGTGTGFGHRYRSKAKLGIVEAGEFSILVPQNPDFTM